MGLFSNFFKSNALPEDEIQESENVMRKLQEKRQEDTHQWVASIQDPGSLLPPSYTKVKVPPKPTIEDVDQREPEDSFVYQPPVEAMYTPFDEENTQGGLARVKNISATDWVSKMFGEFERQSSVFNASAQGTNLVLSIHPPQYAEEVVSGGVYGKDTRVRFFKGYVSTTYWGMLLHGHHDKIDIYIVPAEAILQMTLSDISQSGFSPYLTIDSQITGGDLEWHVGGTVISYGAVPNLARELLADLIKVASGKVKGDELFAEHSAGLKLDQGAAQNLSQVLRAVPEEAGSVSTATAVKPAAAAPTGTDPLADLLSFRAAATLADAILQDLPVLSRLLEPDARTEESVEDRARELGTALRSLHGNVTEFISHYQPRKG